jgi:Uma2 family endonuclease
MNLHVQQPMTVDEYLAWALEHPGRYELVDGVVRQMSPEKVGHAHAKGLAYIALRTAVARVGSNVIVLPDGATVRVAKDTAFEPDALGYAPPMVDPDSLEIPNPMIVVEVISPSTHKYDTGFKLQGYTSMPSMQHVLIVNAKTQTILHHRRISETKFEMTTISEGILRLDPPGLEIPVSEFFAVD